MFLSFEFQKDRMKNVGAVVGGQNFAPPIEKAHRLYNSLLLPHKPWWYCPLLYQIMGTMKQVLLVVVNVNSNHLMLPLLSFLADLTV